MNMDRRVWVIGWGTLVLFGLGGIWIIQLFQGRSLSQVLAAGVNPLLQLAAGVLAGSLSAGAALFVINRPFFREHKSFYYRLISSKIPLNYGVITFLSICAGAGEEIFFRAGLQPLIGLWITSFLFVALHGYFSLKNTSLSWYGLLMFLIIAGFGYMYRHLGLISVMTAHTLFDFILFAAIYGESRKLKATGNTYEEEESHMEI